jgi:hypothetical protein
MTKTQVGHFNVYGLMFIGALASGVIGLGCSMHFLNRNKPDTEHTKKRKKILRAFFMPQTVS